MSRIKVIAAVGAAILIFTLVILLVPYRTWAYRGPGTIRDGGILSYPRFAVDLPPMALNQEQSRTFTFSGIPSEEMSLTLAIVGSSTSDSETLGRLQTQITARLVDESDPLKPTQVCSAAGSPASRSPDSQWVVHSSSTFAEFWHCRCLRLPLSSNRTYTLYLEVKTPDLSSAAKVLVPTLKGGGYEWP